MWPILLAALIAMTPCPPAGAPTGHRRIATERGPVHVFAPEGELDSIVVYVHGYRTDVDRAARDHALGAQFARSCRRALFIVPEAPSGPGEPVRWPSVEALIDRVERELSVRLGTAALELVGHSGAYRTLGRWLSSPRVGRVVLLDAAYGDLTPFASWARSGDHRLVLVGRSTFEKTRALAVALDPTAECGPIPRDAAVLAGARRISCFRSQYGHMEIVESGRVIPVVLAP